MQPEPQNADGDGLTPDEPTPRADSEVPPSPKAQAHPNQAGDQAPEKPPTAMKEGPSRLWRWLTLGYGERWWFDDSPSIFEAMTFIVSVVGVFFLIWQWQQTNDALVEARKSTAEATRSADAAIAANQLTALAQAKDDLADDEDAKRDERTVAAAEASAEASIGAMEIQRQAAQAELRARIGVEFVEFDKNPISTFNTGVVRVVNAGRSPAFNLDIRTIMRVSIIVPGLLSWSTLDAPDARPAAPAFVPSVLRPGMTATYRFYGGPERHDPILGELKQPSLGGPPIPGMQGVGLVVVGEVRYFDMFKQRHLTRFCMFTDLSSPARPCPDNNYAE